MDFDKRSKEVEARFTEKLTDMRKQLDTRWKQIDKFESSLKTYADTKAAWKRKFSQKEGELEAIKARVNFSVSFVSVLTGLTDYQCGDGCAALRDEETRW